MTDTLPFRDLETVYDLIALGIDRAGPDKESLFLAKLCLTLAHYAPDLSTVEEAIRIAGLDLGA